MYSNMPSKRRTSVHEWVLYGSAFIMLMAILSSIHAIGTLFPYFLDEFGENRAKTAAIQSVFYGVGLGCSKYMHIGKATSKSTNTVNELCMHMIYREYFFSVGTIKGPPIEKVLTCIEIFL